MKVREIPKSAKVVAGYLGTSPAHAGQLARYGIVGVRQEDGTILVPGWELGETRKLAERFGCTITDAARLFTLRTIAIRLHQMWPQAGGVEYEPLQRKGAAILWFLRRSKSKAIRQAASRLAHDYGSGPGQFLQTA